MNAINIEKYTIFVQINIYEQYEIGITIKDKIKAFSFFLNDSFEILENEAYSLKRIGDHKYSIILHTPLSQLSIRYRRPYSGRLVNLNDSIWLPIPTKKYFINILDTIACQENIYWGNLGYSVRNRIENIVLVEATNSQVMFKVFDNQVLYSASGFMDETIAKKELIYLLSFFESITGEKATFVNICCNDIPARSVSYKNLIMYHSSLLLYKNSGFYLYFAHELFHQVIGNEIVFIGAGKMWLKESFTEYLQLRFLKERFGEKIYRKRCAYYMSVYDSYFEHEMPLVDIDERTDMKTYMATIASKGVLIFAFLFEKCRTEEIRAFIKKLMQENRELGLNDFFTLAVSLIDQKGFDYKNVIRKGIDCNMRQWMCSFK